MPSTPRITPFLWFADRLEEAMQFYPTVFPDAKIGKITRHGDKVFSATFELGGQQFMALNGGPRPFTDAISFFVRCETQAEVDDLWAKLTADGGEESRCGWCKDKFGLSWQIIPDALGRYLSDPDAAKAGRVVQAMMQMRKIDIAALDRAAAG